MSAANHTPMTVEAGRALCKITSDACNVDFDDNWKVYGDSYLADAQVVLEAAAVPELLAALQQLLPHYRTAVKLYDPNTDDAFTVAARIAIAKATGGAA